MKILHLEQIQELSDQQAQSVRQLHAKDEQLRQLQAQLDDAEVALVRKEEEFTTVRDQEVTTLEGLVAQLEHREADLESQLDALRDEKERLYAELDAVKTLA